MTYGNFSPFRRERGESRRGHIRSEIHVHDDGENDIEAGKVSQYTVHDIVGFTDAVENICNTQAAFLASEGFLISDIMMKNMKCPAKAKTGLVIDTKAS